MFNQLTSSKLADCSLFNNILDQHYEKFQYLYDILSNVDQSLIDDISCHESESYIKVYITPYKNNNINLFRNKMLRFFPKKHLFIEDVYKKRYD